MKPELLRHLAAAGATVDARASAPFPLHQPDTVWLVTAGRLDVFFTALHDGQPAGARTCVFSSEPGATLFGLPLLQAGRDHGLIAVGTPDTGVVAFPLASFRALMDAHGRPDDLVYCVEEWVAALTRGIIPPYAPRDFVSIPLGGSFTASRHICVRPADRLLWFRHTRGGSSYLSNTNLYLAPADPYIPLLRESWLETAEAENELVTRTTGEYLARPAELWASISAFTAMVLECRKLAVLETAEAEADKSAQRRARDAHALHGAIAGLAAVLDPPDAAAADAAGGDHLYAVCLLVAQAQGITLCATAGAARHGSDPLDDLVRASRIRTRQVLLRDDWWRRDCGPLVAWRAADRTPVALLPAADSRYTLVDPQAQSRVTVDRAVAASLAPEANAFYRTFAPQTLTLPALLRFALHDSLRDLGRLVLLGATGGLLATLLPLASGMIMDDIIPQAARGQLWQMTAGLIVFALAQLLFQVTRGYAQLRLETRIDSAVQAAVWDRLLDLPVPFYRQFTVGDLAQRANGINQIRLLLTGATAATLLGSIFSVFSFALLFWYSVPLALLATVLVALSLAVTITVSYINLRYQKRILALAGQLSGAVLQFITGISKLRVAGAEARAFAFWARQFAQQRRLTVAMESVTNAYTVFNVTFTTFCQFGIYAWLAFALMREQAANAAFTTGDFVAFSAAFAQCLVAMSQFGTVVVSLLQVVPLYERARPILDCAPEVREDKTDPGRLRGDLDVASVSFRYLPDAPLTLDTVSLQARAGEFIAIVGASGSGKSTLLRLLLGFEQPQAGTVAYDGCDLGKLDVRLLRRQLGVVLQNGRILSGDLFNNIVGASRLTLDDAWAAARMAGLEDDIKAMPMGMHTFISEGGSTLSGGQRQRLLIARALVHQPRIILFDEATSALDNVTQQIVAESLARLDVTRVVIAHRLSTIINADRIYVMAAGCIAESGTYEDLMIRNGLFADLARRQII